MSVLPRRRQCHGDAVNVADPRTSPDDFTLLARAAATQRHINTYHFIVSVFQLGKGMRNPSGMPSQREVPGHALALHCC